MAGGQGVRPGSIEGEPDAPESASARTVARANRNLHFCRFFAHGRALDTEELVMITSRSPRYYVSAASWPRDTLLWALPAMLQSDPDFARRVLEATFARHMNNMGVHAHYMDGVLLYPGFELDQLCAYVIALAGYIRHTSDGTILGRDKVEAGLARFEAELERRRHPEAHLYSTFLDPSDDPVKYPYLTYDNVLVWRALADLAHVRAEQGKKESAQRLSALADAVRHTIMENCVVDGPTGPMFAWSVDLAGRYELYDDPPGSLVASLLRVHQHRPPGVQEHSEVHPLKPQPVLVARPSLLGGWVRPFAEAMAHACMQCSHGRRGRPGGREADRPSASGRRPRLRDGMGNHRRRSHRPRLRHGSRVPVASSCQSCPGARPAP